MFTTKPVNTQTLGEYLRECRERADLPLAEVAKTAAVQPKHITALEEGRFETLPAAVYVQGFLKSLARVYRVDAEYLLVLYQSERRVAENLRAAEKGRAPKRFHQPKFILNPRTATVGIIGLLGLLSLSYLYFQVRSLNRPPRLEVFSPSADFTTDTSLVEVSGITEAGASVYFNNEPVVAELNGEFRETVTLAPGTNRLIVRAVNKFGQESELSRNINFAQKEIAGSATAKSGELSLRLEIVIGEKPVRLELAADGAVFFSGILSPGASKIVEARERAVLSSDNGGMTRVILNGKDLGVLGKDGEEIRDIEFTR